MKQNIPTKWKASWIAPSTPSERHPVLRKRFSCEDIKNAYLYVTGLGLFEVYLNGEKLGDQVLTPFFDDYNSQVQVLAFEISEKLKKDNTLEIMLGNGWYKGRFGFIDMPNRYGDEFCAIAQLEMVDTNGSESVLVTDESWECVDSVVINSGIYDGEEQDFTKASVEASPVKLVDRDMSALKPQTSAPLRVMEHIPVKEIITTPKGEVVLDFGQNFAGWVEFRYSQKGSIHLDFGEVLVDGSFYNDNYNTAKGGFTVNCDGSDRVYRPYFTYFGFRYVRVTGWENEIKAEDFKGCVIHSDLPRTGYFICGDERINRLYENILWSQRSNFLDVPTDCPQRSERLPWSGDAQIFAPTACYNMDCRTFYPHYLDLMRRDQLMRDGGISNYLPQDFVFAEPTAIWGDAAVMIPITLYERYGDISFLADNYPMMKDWADYLVRQDDAHGGRRLWDYGFQFGDWLALDGPTDHSFKGRTEDGMVATFAWYNTMKEMCRVANILKYQEDEKIFEKVASEIKEAVLCEYFTSNGRLAVDTQTAYLLALRYDLCPDKERIIKDLTARLEKDCWEITSGFAAAPVICSILAENGLEDAAFRILMNSKYPGWLYQIDSGATTIWERWNSLMPNGMINPMGMNSFNHYSYGSVGQYLYENIAGLRSTEPGFKSIYFNPYINGKLGHCNCKYISASGTWESSWQVNSDGTVDISLTVPEGCWAEVHLPHSGKEIFEVQSGQWNWNYTPNCNLNSRYNQESILRELADDPNAVSVLQKITPSIFGMMMSGDREILANSIGALAFNPQFGVNPEAAAELISELSQMTY